MTTLNIVMAQMNTLVGDFSGNTTKIIESANLAAQESASADDSAQPVAVVIFPELTLCGYPPEDLLLRDSIELRVNHALNKLCQELPAEMYTVIGFPRKVGDKLYNAAAVIHHGTIIAEYHKQFLPNYQVFDEKRYFSAGSEPCIVQIEDVCVAITICEDIWEDLPSTQAATAGAQLMINLNASPYHVGKQGERRELVSRRAKAGGFAIVYVNQVGGQDELVFDGGSFVVDETGRVCAAAENFAEGDHTVSMIFPVDPLSPLGWRWLPRKMYCKAPGVRWCWVCAIT